MRNIKIYLLCVLMFFSGCKTAKKVFGFGEDKGEQSSKNTPVKIVPPVPSEKVAITSTTLSNWALYSLITLAILFSIRCGLKKYKQNK